MAVGFVSELRNLQTVPNEKSSLSKEEINVVFAVLNKVFEHEKNCPKQGTFILAGQKDGREPFKIISCEFPRGEKKNFVASYRSSRNMAEDVVYAASTYKKEGGGSALNYMYNTPYFIRLNTDNGRFLVAFFVDTGEFSFQTLVYMAIVRTLAELRRGDKILEESCEHTFFTEIEDSPGLAALEVYVKSLFEECSLPELEEWQKWYASRQSLGKGITSFFAE